jgi:LPPG:FO 2-phospho-L-lactate transferase
MKITVLSGGVGGARFADGIVQAHPENDVSIIVNTGDDFRHWGLHISPAVDTVMYTLSGLADEARGWGLRDETYQALEMMNGLGGENWFQLGDRDLATHIYRSEQLANGVGLTEITRHLTQRVGLGSTILPMSDDLTPTMIETRDEGILDFQTWLVRRRAKPAIVGIRYEGAPVPTAAMLAAIDAADCILIAPSNPYVSIEPILRLESIRERLMQKTVVGVSPLVHGEAVKGPLASMIRELDDRAPSAHAVAWLYRDILNGFVVAAGDEAGQEVRCLATDIIMHGREDRPRLAREVLQFAEDLIQS